MALKIQTTGLEQYAPGGQARLKIMLIGGPGAGKTRVSSYWPKPIYADCEAGLASIADRAMPFVSIRNSNDMLEFLTDMRLESNRPYDQRRFQTVVIDTLDAFQRKVMDEWLLANPGAGSFRGYDAWGYLDAKMGMLLTRLLNLDMNVIVNVHYTDKTIKEGSGDNTSERQELQLQLSGSIKDRVFNDFDLVGWMGRYYEAVEGQRVEKRGLTFKSTPDKPFLKDRLHVTPDWMEVVFADSDYETLFSAFAARLDEFAPTETIGEITPLGPDTGAGGGIEFGGVAGGPVEAIDPKDIPLSQFDKPTLQKIARDEGVTVMPDGQPIKGNTLKGELVAAIEHHRAKATAAEAATTLIDAQGAPVAVPDGGPVAQAVAQPEPVAQPAAAPTVAEVTEAPAPVSDATPASAPAEPAAPAAEPAPAQAPVSETPVSPEPAAQPTPPAPAAPQAPAAPAEAPQNPPTPVQAAPLAVTPDGVTYDPATGAVVEATEAEAVATVAAALGGEVQPEVTSQPAPAEVTPAPVAAAPAPAVQPELAQAPAAAPAGEVCENCQKDLGGENQDYVKLAFIKFRKKLCNAHYLEAKKAS